MSSQLEQRRLLALLMPFVIILAIAVGVVATTGIIDFGRLLIDKNPFAIGVTVAVAGAVLFLANRIMGLNEPTV